MKGGVLDEVCPALPVDKRHVCNSENDKAVADSLATPDLREECATTVSLLSIPCLPLYTMQRLKAREVVMGVIKDSTGMIYEDFRDAVGIARTHYTDLWRMRHVAQGLMLAHALNVYEPWYEAKLTLSDALRHAKKAALEVAQAELNVASSAVSRFKEITSREWQLEAADAMVSKESMRKAPV